MTSTRSLHDYIIFDLTTTPTPTTTTTATTRVTANKQTNKVGPLTHLNEYIFWFHISMKNAISVHVVDGLAQLVHVELHLLLREEGFTICRRRFRGSSGGRNRATKREAAREAQTSVLSVTVMYQEMSESQQPMQPQKDTQTLGT